MEPISGIICLVKSMNVRTVYMSTGPIIPSERGEIMSERLISKKQFNYLKQELEYHMQNNIITKDQLSSIQNSYQIASSFSFIKIILLIGSILIGLGVLSFVASNWQILGNALRFSLIVALLLVTNLVSFKINPKYPRISHSLLYLSVLVFGAGIFLIGQMFHLGGNFTGAFLMWGLGILPMAIVFREKYLYLFSHLLFLVYLNGHLDLYGFPYLILVIIPVLYYLNVFYDYSKMGTFFNNLLVINTIIYLGSYWHLEPLYITTAVFALGLAMMFVPLRFNKEVFKLQGSLIVGISGLILTFREIWRDVFLRPDTISIVFGILFLIFLFYLVKRKNIISLIFICIIIFRYYVDTMFSFMPKSMFFVVGGLILIGFGYYFEKMRKGGGGIDYEI